MHYIGGNATMAVRYRLRNKYSARYLTHLPYIADQCSCGSYAWVYYRGRWYCPHCGYRRKTDLDERVIR
jgi:hypothetical protein